MRANVRAFICSFKLFFFHFFSFSQYFHNFQRFISFIQCHFSFILGLGLALSLADIEAFFAGEATNISLEILNRSMNDDISTKLQKYKNQITFYLLEMDRNRKWSLVFLFFYFVWSSTPYQSYNVNKSLREQYLRQWKEK